MPASPTSPHRDDLPFSSSSDRSNGDRSTEHSADSWAPQWSQSTPVWSEESEADYHPGSKRKGKRGKGKKRQVTAFESTMMESKAFQTGNRFYQAWKEGDGDPAEYVRPRSRRSSTWTVLAVLGCGMVVLLAAIGIMGITMFFEQSRFEYSSAPVEESQEPTAWSGEESAGEEPAGQSPVEEKPRSESPTAQQLPLGTLSSPSVRATQSIGSRAFRETTDQVFLLVDFRFTYQGTDDYLLGGDDFRAMDSTGTVHQVSDRIFLDAPGKLFQIKVVKPGETVEGYIVFEVPPGTELKELQLQEFLGEGRVVTTSLPAVTK